MSDLLEFLRTRNSAPKLGFPGPNEQELNTIIEVATRAPDHAWLRPWRFIAIEGSRRDAFGEILAESLQLRDPEASESAVDRARLAPLRAPVMLAVVVRFSEHPKVPRIEQSLSAGCAAHGILLAAEALGYAAIWRTGEAAFDRRVMDALGLADNEELVGFLYLGTRQGDAKPLPDLASADFLSRW